MNYCVINLTAMIYVAYEYLDDYCNWDWDESEFTTRDDAERFLTNECVRDNGYCNGHIRTTSMWDELASQPSRRRRGS